ncbi:hypothetical protein SDC49_19700 [Lactobacillus sp. R2/2]|nr:hypothetical protein [Lactobacillus sp. R2/2]
MGKEMVQNILPLRLTNPLIKNVWNNENIKNVQVTLAERLGVEARGVTMRLQELCVTWFKIIFFK